jgi:hypothetical protein
MTRTIRVAATILLVLAAGTLTSTRMPARAQPALMSPEEAAVQLQPYLLTADTAPSGYDAGSPSVDGPASLAFFDTSGASPLAVVDRFEQQGFVLQSTQTLFLARTSTIIAAPESANFHIYVLRTPKQAQAVVANQTVPIDPSWPVVQPLSGLAVLGDGGVLYDLSGDNAEAIEYRWSRGALAFEVFARVGSGGPAGVMNLATALDTVVANNQPFDLSSPQVAPPATQSERLRALLRMSTIAVPAVAIPNGLTTTEPSISTSVGSVALATQPTDALLHVDTKWQRVAGLARLYASSSSATRYFCGFTEDASAAAQTVDFRDFSAGSGPPPRLEPSPVALGDDAYLRRTQITVSGRKLDSVILAWRHGPLALLVQVSDKPGSVKDADVAAFAQAIDAAYQQSAYAQ